MFSAQIGLLSIKNAFLLRTRIDLSEAWWWQLKDGPIAFGCTIRSVVVLEIDFRWS